MVMGGWSRWATAARLGALFGRASAWPAGGPHLLCTLSCAHPLSGGGHSSAALGAGLLHSVSCVRARCAYDPWHVRGGWTDAVSPGRCATCRPRAPRPLPRCGHEGPNRPRPSGTRKGGPGRTQGAASVPPCEARTAREVDSATAAGSVPPGTHTSPAPGSRSPRPQLAVSHARAPYGKISRPRPQCSVGRGVMEGRAGPAALDRRNVLRSHLVHHWLKPDKARVSSEALRRRALWTRRGTAA